MKGTRKYEEDSDPAAAGLHNLDTLYEDLPDVSIVLNDSKTGNDGKRGNAGGV